MQVCAADAGKAAEGMTLLISRQQLGLSQQRFCPGAASRSFTSTAVNVVTKNERKMIRVERHPKAKAYLRLHTSLGYVRVCTDVSRPQVLCHICLAQASPPSTATELHGPVAWSVKSCLLVHAASALLLLALQGLRLA